MGTAVLDISMSLDGFIAGSNDDVGRLHDWLFNGENPSRYNDFFKLSEKGREVFDELVETTGSIIVGRRLYDLVGGWGGSHPLHGVPAFILTHKVPEKVPQGATPFTFVTDGIESALRQARTAAGDKNVYVVGGADIAQQYIKAGLLDELCLHIVPVLFNEGVRLFDHLGDRHIEFEQTQIVESSGVTHLRFRVAK